jgi:hypothetical protein
MQANNFIWCSTKATTFCSNGGRKLAVQAFLTDSIYIQNGIQYFAGNFKDFQR